MFHRKTCREITQDWGNYREPIKKAFTSNPGSLAMGGDKFDKFEKTIKLKLTNPFQNSMQLWVFEDEGGVRYIILTKLQICEFSQNKTLVWFSATKIDDVDETTKEKAYLEGYKTLTKFAKKNDCVGIIGYSDLDYFEERRNELKEWMPVIHRHLFYFPLED